MYWKIIDIFLEVFVYDCHNWVKWKHAVMLTYISVSLPVLDMWIHLRNDFFSTWRSNKTAVKWLTDNNLFTYKIVIFWFLLLFLTAWQWVLTLCHFDYLTLLSYPKVSFMHVRDFHKILRIEWNLVSVTVLKREIKFSYLVPLYVLFWLYILNWIYKGVATIFSLKKIVLKICIAALKQIRQNLSVCKRI